jgi:sporulation protein YunB
MIPEVFSMRRSSVLYRRLWYIRRRRSKGLHIFVRIVIILAVFFMLASLANRSLMPCLVEIAETKARAMVSMSANTAVNEVFSDNIRYEDLTVLNRDQTGRITSIETNVSKLNKLSAQVSLRIQQKLADVEKQRISIPFGSLFGSSIFAGSGPDLSIRVRNAGSIETDYKSEFFSAGINQTKHKIYVHVKTTIGMYGPMTNEKIDIVTKVPVAETVIVGDVPGIYLNMHK